MKKYIYLMAFFIAGLCSAQLATINKAEYFWDTDPGEGSGIAIIPFDGNYNTIFEKFASTGLGAPSTGLHKFSVRVKDNLGIWGPAFTNIVKVEPTTTPITATVTQAEYFWDNNPGEGNGTEVAAFDGNYNSIFESFALTGLGVPSVGIHKFSVRVKDDSGVWGPVFTNIIKVEPTTTPVTATLSQAEYFWDNDPGEGSGTVIPAFDGDYNSIFESFALTGLGAPSVGVHKFSVRVKDDSGVWGQVFTNIIKVEATTTPIPTTLAQAEYFWDNDPGEGNGASLTALDGNFDNAVESILKNNISISHLSGLHIFNVRVKDNQGVWGTVFKNVVYIENTVLGTNQVKATKNIVCYPNPADDIINFNATGKMNIFSSEGRLVISKDKVDGSKGVNITSLTKGNYILTIENKEGRFSSKFIKK